MTDRHLDLLVRAADPCPSIADLDLARAEEALLAEICATAPVNRFSLAQRRARRARQASALRTRLAVAVVTAGAITAAIGVPAIFAERHTDIRGGATAHGPESTTPTPSQPSTRPAQPQITRVTYAAAAIKVARENPRVLVTAAGWKVRSVEGFDPDAGEMTFQLGPDRWHDQTFAGGSTHLNAAPQLQVAWYPSGQYESYRADRAQEPHLQHIALLGHRAQMISYSRTDHAVMLPPQGKVFLELRGSNIGDEDAFKRFLASSVQQVDIRTWLAAMPASVVTADNVDASVRRALTGVPLPPGFDPSALDRGLALDSYQFGARLSGMVACGWIEQWQRARAAGDTAAAQRAVAALATSHDWKVLRDMDAEGDYPEVLWQYADALAAPGAGESAVDGYRGALGCH